MPKRFIDLKPDLTLGGLISALKVFVEQNPNPTEEGRKVTAVTRFDGSLRTLIVEEPETDSPRRTT